MRSHQSQLPQALPAGRERRGRSRWNAWTSSDQIPIQLVVARGREELAGLRAKAPFGLRALRAPSIFVAAIGLAYGGGLGFLLVESAIRHGQSGFEAAFAFAFPAAVGLWLLFGAYSTLRSYAAIAFEKDEIRLSNWLFRRSINWSSIDSITLSLNGLLRLYVADSRKPVSLSLGNRRPEHVTNFLAALGLRAEDVSR